MGNSSSRPSPTPDTPLAPRLARLQHRQAVAETRHDNRTRPQTPHQPISAELSILQRITRDLQRELARIRIHLDEAHERVLIACEDVNADPTIYRRTVLRRCEERERSLQWDEGNARDALRRAEEAERAQEVVDGYARRFEERDEGNAREEATGNMRESAARLEGDDRRRRRA